jgi:hypothetical protein
LLLKLMVLYVFIKIPAQRIPYKSLFCNTNFHAMLKINFKEHVLPHGFAIVVFFIVTIFFFNPIFFDNRSIAQGDITQFLWGSKALRDYRTATGEEGLWANAMFGGMPAYLVNLDWSDGVLTAMKKVLSVFLPHPVANIFLAFGVILYFAARF